MTTEPLPDAALELATAVSVLDFMDANDLFGALMDAVASLDPIGAATLAAVLDPAAARFAAEQREAPLAVLTKLMTLVVEREKL